MIFISHGCTIRAERAMIALIGDLDHRSV